MTSTSTYTAANKDKMEAKAGSHHWTPPALDISRESWIVQPISSRNAQTDDSTAEISLVRDGTNEQRTRASRQMSLPSPPLTRVGTNETRSSVTSDDVDPKPSSTRLGEGKESPYAAKEMDIGEWHPLGNNNTHEDLSTPPADHVETRDTPSNKLFLDTHPAPLSAGSSRISFTPHHPDLKPPSPQPWDLISPPPTNGMRRQPDDYYSAAGTHKFHTLQSRNRPLKPQSSYYFGPPPSDSAYGTRPIGQIGVHHPREILRVERDYTGGELIQFAPIYPLELDGRITPTQFLESVNAINEVLISAHSIRHSFFDNLLAILSLQLSRLFVTSHFDKEMRHLERLFDELNAEVYNPVGLHLLWPRQVGFLFLEIEYY